MVPDCKVLEIPEFRDGRGALSVLEHPATIPFEPVRLFFIHDVPPGARRGGHAHRACHELLVAVGGRVVVELTDPDTRRTVVLDGPTTALHLAPMTWLDLTQFNQRAVVMVLCSHGFDEDDYIRDRATFERVAKRVS